MDYLRLLLFSFIAFGMGAALIIAAKIFSVHAPNKEKNAPYECGFEEIGDVPIKFDIRYYLIAIIFILFDIEIAFLIPWALVFKQVSNSLTIISVFLIVLVAGFAYIWRKGALEWQ